jgi:hypothetical protein
MFLFGPRKGAEVPDVNALKLWKNGVSAYNFTSNKCF